jgi:hypothetical protein
MNWCISLPNPSADSAGESWERHDAVNKCIACRNYETEALQDIDAAKRYHCPFAGARWDPNGEDHFGWCMGLSPDTADDGKDTIITEVSNQETDARRQALAECKAAKQNEIDFCTSYVAETKDLIKSAMNRSPNVFIPYGDHFLYTTDDWQDTCYGRLLAAGNTGAGLFSYDDDTRFEFCMSTIENDVKGVDHAETGMQNLVKANRSLTMLCPTFSNRSLKSQAKTQKNKGGRGRRSSTSNSASNNSSRSSQNGVSSIPAAGILDGGPGPSAQGPSAAGSALRSSGAQAPTPKTSSSYNLVKPGK